MKIIIYITLYIFTSSLAIADEYRPAYLELKQQTDEAFDMLWKVPARGMDKRLSLYVSMPDDVETVKPMRTSFVGSAFIERSTISRVGGLKGVEIVIDGLSKLPTDVLVRIERIDGSTEVARLTSAMPSFVVKGTPKFWEVAQTYLVFGVEHILGGNDHLLFVACLILIAGTWRRILITITGFTLAHSVTLTLAALELVRLPVPPIEAVIALSIVFLAREIALNRRDTLTWRYPIAVSATFGLLHGFGFASALSEIGLPQTEIPAALLSFNVGVEIGQIMFVAVLLLIAFVVKSLVLNKKALPEFSSIQKPASYLIGSLASFWMLERMAGFWV